MTRDSLRETLRWLGWVALAVWLGLAINHEILQQDPSQFGFRNPEVEAEMKNCTSEDMRLRYECKEQVILASQRRLFLEASGRAVLIFLPPILVWLIARRLLRPGDAGRLAQPPPSIQKWRVKWPPASPAS